jgi:phage replication O-like protein O
MKAATMTPDNEKDKHPSTDNPGGFYVDYPFANLEDNFTKYPNDILDYLMRYYGGSAFQLLSVIIRKTIGWHKNWDRISYSQFEEYTGLGRQAVADALKELLTTPSERIDDPGAPTEPLIISYRKGQDIWYSLNPNIGTIKVFKPRSIEEEIAEIEAQEVENEAKNPNQYENQTSTSMKIKLVPVRKSNTQKTIKDIKDTGRIGIDDYIDEMLKAYNKTFNKKARRSKAVEKAAAELMLKEVPIMDYVEGCKRYQAHGTRNIRGPESIAPWAENVKKDREQGVTVGSQWGWDANMNWVKK